MIKHDNTTADTLAVIHPVIQMVLIVVVILSEISIFASAILFIIQGFRVHWGWGLANVFLFPFAGIAFFFKHRREAKLPMFFLAVSMASMFMAAILFFLRFFF